MKKYTFFDDSYYDQPGCSCCEGTLMEAFNSNDTDCNLGTAHSYEDCYVYAIMTENAGKVPLYLDKELYEMNIKELKALAKQMNIEVEIIS